MLLKFLLQGLGLAITANAVPTYVDEYKGAEFVRFKRDVVLESRDIELAELHQVNLTEMYQHSVVKRDDGDHMTIWVSNDFHEAEGPGEDPSLEGRDITLGRDYHAGIGSDQCRDHDRVDTTDGGSPYTGGLDAIVNWCNSHTGVFRFGDGLTGGYGQKTIMIGGTNSGHNVRLLAQFIDGRHPGTQKYYGVRDIHNDVDWTRSRRRQINGRWRAASYGWETCDGNSFAQSGRLNYLIRSTPDEA